MGTTGLDRATFERLVLEHLPAVHRFAIRLTFDADAAEEVMQDALLKATRSWTTFAGRSTFRTWLLQVVVNAFRDRCGALQAARRNGAGGPVPEEFEDARATDPARRASQAEQGERVARMVSGLPPRQREVFVLHAYEGLSTAQAAVVLGISESNARANLHFARRKLQELLGPEIDQRRRDGERSQEART